MASQRAKSGSLKDGILAQIGEQIKALQLGHQYASEKGITDYKVTCKNIHLQCLLDLLDHILLHGLVNVENGYWPFVVKLTHSETVKLISKHPQVTNDLDRGRIWVFVAVCEGLLESYIRLFITGQKAAKKLYTRESFLRDKERLIILLTLVSGLDYVEVALDLSSPYLGYGSLPLPLPKVIGSPANNLRTNHRSRSRHSSISSSVSNSSTIVAPTSPTGPRAIGSETFELADCVETRSDSKEQASNGLSNHQENGLQSHANQTSNSNETLSLLQNFVTHTSTPNKPVYTDQSLVRDAELLTLMDPRFSSVEDGAVRAVNDPTIYDDFPSDFRRRLGSNLSEISTDDGDIVFQHEQIRKRRIMRRKKKFHAGVKEDVGGEFLAPDDREQNKHEVSHEAEGEARVYARTSSYLSDYFHEDSESVGSSVVSGDSLDQFCRDADFGSSLNLSTEISVQPTVHECLNEQPTVDEQKPGDEEVKFETQTSGECEGVIETSAEYEGIILGLPKRPALKDLPGNSCNVRVDPNTLLLISLEIFKHGEEQFYRMVRTSTGHHYGQLQCAYVMLTDFAVYLLRKVTFREETSFHTDMSIMFTNIKIIEIGLNCQTVKVASKKEQFVITFGDEAVSRIFISSLTSQMARSSPSLSLSNLVSSAAVQQETNLTKWMSKDKYLNMATPNTTCFSLVHWCGLTGPDSKIEVISYSSVMEGTLEFKQQNYLAMRPRWTKGYFVLTNGTLWQYNNQNDKAARAMIDLRASRCGGCRQLHDTERPYAFEIVSSDGTGSLLVLAAQSEHEACEWIFKICQSIAESYDDDSDRGCTVMQCVPCNLVTTKEKVVICLAQQNSEIECKLVTSCPVQSIIKIFVDNQFRNYCIIKFEYGEVVDKEGSWFVWFNTEYELGKFEHSIAEAWRELFQVDLQFLVLGNNKTRDEARERANKIAQFYTD